MRTIAALAILAAAGVALASFLRQNPPAAALALAGLPTGSSAGGSDIPPGATPLSDGAGWVGNSGPAAPWALEPGARTRAAEASMLETCARWRAEGRAIADYYGCP